MLVDMAAVIRQFRSLYNLVSTSTIIKLSQLLASAVKRLHERKLLALLRVSLVHREVHRGLAEISDDG